jgi:phosphatidylethanolamine-binding protein (PEBP) family uncharacterized protein
VKIILSILAFAGVLLFVAGAIICMIMVFGRNPDQKKRDRYAKIALAGLGIGGLSMVLYFAAAIKQYSTIDIDSFPKFEVTSNNLNDGKWDAVITNTERGKNESPQLQWQPVSGATTYAVIMVDPDGSNWLHWFAVTDKTCLEQGEFIGEINGYVGPYPPSGTHHYTIYVFALKGTPFAVDEKIDFAGADIEVIAKELNSGQMSEHNNILEVGILEGTYCVED